MLDDEVVSPTIVWLKSLRNYPWPQSWHYYGDYEDFGVTDEEWDSAFNNSAKNREAISMIPQLQFKRR
jgi:hypothetical protein